MEQKPISNIGKTVKTTRNTTSKAKNPMITKKSIDQISAGYKKFKKVIENAKKV